MLKDIEHRLPKRSTPDDGSIEWHWLPQTPLERSANCAVLVALRGEFYAANVIALDDLAEPDFFREITLMVEHQLDRAARTTRFPPFSE